MNAQSSSGNTPLIFACCNGHVEVVKVLLAHGANVEDSNENGHTPLMEAASAGFVPIAQVSVLNRLMVYVNSAPTHTTHQRW